MTFAHMCSTIVKALMIFQGFVNFCRCAQEVDEAILHRKLFENYNSQVRPVLNVDDVMDVSVHLYLLRITDLSEKNQILSSTIWVSAFWRDDLIHWNVSEYKDVDMIVVDKRKIWTPDILIQNEVGNKRGIKDSAMMNDPKVWSNGRVQMWTFKQVRTTCVVDPTKFPFDTQNCFLEISKWYNDDSKLNITELHDFVGVDFFEKSEEWDLFDSIAEKNVHMENDQNYSRIRYNLTLRRRPLFSALNLILPLVVLIALNQLCFYLPIESGEKIGFGLSTFLTFVVFLTLISDTLPQSSIHISIFGSYLVFQLAISALIIGLEVFVLRTYYYKSYRISMSFAGSFFRNIFEGKICYADICARNRRNSIHKRKNTRRSLENEDIYENNITLQDFGENKVSRNHVSEEDKTVTSDKGDEYYQELAIQMDRICARVIPVVNLVAFLTMFILIYT